MANTLGDTARRREEIRDDLRKVINKHSLEQTSNTPDFILAEYLMTCLTAYDFAYVQKAVHNMKDMPHD